MLSLRHSIGNVSPLESLARNSQSVPHFRCYASPPRTETYALTEVIMILALSTVLASGQSGSFIPCARAGTFSKLLRVFRTSFARLLWRITSLNTNENDRDEVKKELNNFNLLYINNKLSSTSSAVTL